MKLIIDIPEQMYLNAKTDTLCGADILVKAIKNGIPLEDEQIIATLMLLVTDKDYKPKAVEIENIEPQKGAKYDNS